MQSLTLVLKTIGYFLLGFCILLALTVIANLFIIGGVSLSERILPWCWRLSTLALVVSILFLLPLALIRKTRSIAAIGIYICSYVYGISAWFTGLLLTYSIWGSFAVLVGLFFLGIGVVPIAILATLFNGLWAELGILIALCVLTFGSRLGSIFLLKTLETDPISYADDAITQEPQEPLTRLFGEGKQVPKDAMTNQHGKLAKLCRFVIAVIAGAILGNILAVVAALGIDIVYGREVTGGDWLLTTPNVIYAAVIGLLVGLFAGLIAKRRGWLAGTVSQFLPLFVGIAISIYVNRDLQGNYQVKPAVWTWIGLLPAMLGGHLGSWLRK